MKTARALTVLLALTALALGSALATTACSDSSNGGGSSSDAGADGSGDVGQSSTEVCMAACIDAAPAGATVFRTFESCVTDACDELDPESDEAFACFIDAFAPSLSGGACRAETFACFSGPVQGCAELLDVASVACEPDTTPMNEETMLSTVWCLINQGWLAGEEAQALAWPLFQCALPLSGEGGCLEECANGAAACRACAATTCAAEYGACTAHTRGPATNLVPPAAQQSCQRIMNCQSECG